MEFDNKINSRTNTFLQPKMYKRPFVELFCVIEMLTPMLINVYEMQLWHLMPVSD